MKNNVRFFFTALMFYTRIPCPEFKDYHPSDLNKASRYFPLIGWIVGLISAFFYLSGSWLLGHPAGVILSLMAGVLTTGAFHEDGLADAFDGFGGGWTKERILEIMKDSRIGTYGTVALIFLFGIKYLALYELLARVSDPLYIILIFTAYHSVSRLTAILISFTSPYSRDDATSKVKPIAVQHTWKEVTGAVIFGIIPLFALMYFSPLYSTILLPLTVLYYYARQYFVRWIDGYTGDCLGATEQIAECICLLTFLALWKYM